MAILDVKFIPDPILRVPAKAVAVFDTKLHTLLDNMNETMIHSNGLGLAAPQVAHSVQVAIIDVTLDYMPLPIITSLSGHTPESHVHDGRLEVINPEITLKSPKLVSSEEGCLSIPDFRDTIKRHDMVTVRAMDRHGRSFSLEAQELLAYALQHEIDHLHGVLFVDHLSRLKKALFRKWCIKNEFEPES